MRLICLFAFVCLSLANTVLWENYKLHHGKTYNSTQLEAHRYNCFLKNLQIIDQLNAVQSTAKHGLNDFTDMCSDEFKIYHNLVVKPKTDSQKNLYPLFSAKHATLAANQSVDWRTKGAVTPIKNQGQCGSCWSFSSTGNMEGQHFLATGKLVSLSEEELVQCSGSAGNQGCNGGLMDNAFAWVVQNGGIDSEQDYPYTSGGGVVGQCDNSKLKNVVATITSHVDVANDEGQMASFVLANGPMSVAVDASNGWQTYSGGIVTNCDGTQLDHGVLVVGFGTDSGTDYWIVKNSWGPSWGESGYIRLGRGTNQCGINQSPCSSQTSSGPNPNPPPAPGPNPPPTPPPTPGPNPPPTPSSCGDQTYFTQSGECQDANCTYGCQSNSFSTNTCLSAGSDASVKACCSSDGNWLYLTVYQGTTCRSKHQTKTKQPVNQCLQAEDGSYFENVCGSDASTRAHAGSVVILQK